MLVYVVGGVLCLLILVYLVIAFRNADRAAQAIMRQEEMREEAQPMILTEEPFIVPQGERFLARFDAEGGWREN